MKASKIISIVAMSILGTTAYYLLADLTYSYFGQTFHDGPFGIFWPVIWPAWGLHYIAIHYTLAVFVSLFLLVFTWPVMGYGTQVAMHKKAHKTERLKRQLINKAELDEYLRKEGMTLTPHNGD